MKLIKLAVKNLKQKKYRTLLAGLSVAIGTASLIVFLGLSQGIKSATFEEMEKSNPLTQITILPQADKTGFLSFLNTENRLTDQTIKEISKINGVKEVFPEIQFNNFASIEVKLLGFTLLTDTMIFGIEKNFIESDIKGKINWETTQEPYPAIIPKKLLDMYNFTIASPQGLPLISETNLLGKELILYPKYSTFFPGLNKKTSEIKLEIVGFSDKVNLLGATLPYQTVEHLNKLYAINGNGSTKYLEIYVITEKPELTPKIAEEIENLGYKTQYYQKNMQDIEAKFNYLSLSLGAISLIILITAAIAVIGTFLATIAERMKEIGLFRAIGASKAQIKKLILFEAGIIGILGSITGIIIGIIGSKLIDLYGIQQLKTTTFAPTTLFLIDWKLICLTIFFGLILSICSAYLPARTAANLNPITALKK